VLYTTLMLKRNSQNPILKGQADLNWCSKKVYNCAVHKDGGTYHLLFRAIGDDWISRLGLAESTDGITFTVVPSPVMSPMEPWEVKGCEDPRMVRIDDTYYVTYTAYDGITAQAALVSSPDLRTWGKRQLLFPGWQQPQRESQEANWSKAAALYPSKIGNTHHLLFGDDHIWAATSSNLVNWEPAPKPVLSARAGHFDAAYVEMGPPPMLTARGWLVLYHGIDSLSDYRTYSLGAALFASDDPSKLLWRCSSPILTPTESYETVGMIDIINGGFDRLKSLKLSDLQELEAERKLPRAVFCCGALLEDNVVRLYYSGGDTVICTATIDLESIFSA
jgi:beta-1,2-mannosidase